MKKMIILALLCLWGMAIHTYAQTVGCSTPPPCAAPTQQQLATAASLTPANWDWQSCDCKNWYAFINSQTAVSLGNPFFGGSQALEKIRITDDYTKAKGWVLLKKDFGYVANTYFPYFILYNTYTGIMRWFWYNADANFMGENQLMFKVTTVDAAKQTAFNSFANAHSSSPEKYFNGSVSQVDAQVFVTKNPGRNKWVVAEFQMAYDQNTGNAKYTDANILLEVIGMSIGNISGTILGETTTIDQLKADVQSGDASLSFNTNKSFITDVNNFQQTIKKVQKHVNEASEGVKDINASAKKGKETFANKKGYEKTAKMYENIENVTNDEATINKTLSGMSSLLGIVAGGIDLFKSVGSLMGYFGEESTAPTPPPPFVPTVTAYDLKIEATLSYNSTKTQFTLKTPGAPATNTTLPSPSWTYYDCPLGIMNLQSAPKLNYVEFDKNVEWNRVYRADPVNYQIVQTDLLTQWQTRKYRSYKITENIVPVVNSCSNLELMDVKVAITSEGPFVMTTEDKGLNDPNHYSNAHFVCNRVVSGINSENKWIDMWYGMPRQIKINGATLNYLYDDNEVNFPTTKYISVPDYKQFMVNYTYNANQVVKGCNSAGIDCKEAYRWFDFWMANKIYDWQELNEIATGGLELVNYDPELKNHTIQTPLMDIGKMKGLTITVPAQNPVYVKVMALFKKRNGSPNDGLVIFSKTYIPDLTIGTPDRPGPYDGITNLPPYTNKTAEFATEELTVDYKDLTIADYNQFVSLGKPKEALSTMTVENTQIGTITTYTQSSNLIEFKASEVIFKPGTIIRSKVGLSVRTSAPNYYSWPQQTSWGPYYSPAIANCYNARSYRFDEEENPVAQEYLIRNSQIYPNPIHIGQLNFGRPVNTYTLTNSTGTLIQQGNNADKLDVTGLPKGMYMLKLDDKVEKVIVQ